MKGLFITYDLDTQYGGGIISKRNYDELSRKFEVDVFICSTIKMNKLNILINALGCYDHGLTKAKVSEIINKLSNKNYDFIFLDSSLYGLLAKRIKNNFPRIKIITFYHNVEFLFSMKRIQSDGLQYLPLVPSAFINEQLSVKYSDIIIAISDRDRIQINRMYKRNADLIFPITIKDSYDDTNISKANSEIELAFIGSSFFPNRVGITWFVKNVMTKLPDVNLSIVGRGFENYMYLQRDNVKVLGTVDNVKDFYHKANAIVSPIFSGSGMKVKTAEALMMGKTIIGTKEAFIGYKKFNKTIFECKNSNDFIHNIRLLKTNQFFNQENRNYYLDSFSQKTNDLIMTEIERKLTT